MYTIKEAAARTGVAVATLRAWERRYGIVAPTRTASGYRLYDEAALARLASMRRLVDSGWTASNAARAVLDGSAVAPADEARLVHPDEPEPLVERFVRAAATLDARGVELVLDDMFASGSFERMAEEQLLPALKALGDAWASGEVSVAAEHAASHAVHRRLAIAYQAAGAPVRWQGTVLVGLPPGARHELGALCFAVAARRAGLPVLYLGPDLPVADWVRTAAGTGGGAAVIGAITRDDTPSAALVGAAVTAAVPDIVVAFGGRAAPEPEPTDGRSPIVLPDRLTDAVQTLAAAVRATA
jgi:MerR family transcriptional regulator, light-induced transcriptional regulator